MFCSVLWWFAVFNATHRPAITDKYIFYMVSEWTENQISWNQDFCSHFLNRSTINPFRELNTLDRFSAPFLRRQLLWLPVYFSAYQSPFKMGSTLKGKNFLPKGVFTCRILVCTVGIAVPRITCFIVYCRYFLCDVAGMAHCITLLFCARHHLYLLFITSWISRDGEMLVNTW